MAYNDFIIERLRDGFKIDEYDLCTNCALVFAYNGTGKTRLSYDFAHYNREEGSPQHTLYYNAYTEDLFTWDNDLENNTERRLLINQESALIQGLAGYNFSDKLRTYFHLFTNIDFDFHYDENNEKIPAYVTFSKKIIRRVKLNDVWNEIEDEVENIKISRGEERLFVWCFFRCILDQVINGNDAYRNIEYIYIDDPMSSLDDNNVILFAEQLYEVIRKRRVEELDKLKAGQTDFRRIKFIISSHHALFFHVMMHGLAADHKLGRYYLSRDKQKHRLVLKYLGKDDPFYYNVAMMSELNKIFYGDKNGEENKRKLYTYHFTILRSVMEKIQEFFGQRDFNFMLEGIKYKGEKYDLSSFSQQELTDFFCRVMNVLTHQGSIFAPAEMNEDNKELAKSIFDHLMDKFPFKLVDLDDFHSELNN